MSEPWSKQEVARQEIMARFRELHRQRRDLLIVGLRPSHVLLPSRLNVPYDGDDADPTAPATLMGLPILWQDREVWGLAVALPEPREAQHG